MPAGNKLAVAAVIVGAASLFALQLMRPAPAIPGRFNDIGGDPVPGEAVFWAAGCASCHKAPDAKGDDALVLSGGQRLVTEFGTFVVPNISSHPTAGIGNWTLDTFARAMTQGVSPEGNHYYPAFPYTAYALMTDTDVANLFAYMTTLPASDAVHPDHDLSLPYNIRAGLGLWKRLNGDPGFVGPTGTDTLERGRYLVEALAHCAECHTPRDSFGRLEKSAWMAGAPNPSGQGRIPNITPGTLRWSAGDIAYYLETGFTPDFDSAGGHMASVITNMQQLTAEDREAIAAYMLLLPSIP
ncbi:c-type cytochrome [Tropicimonas sp. S265A]|uniref:c-type cytochrome n=1 Tax=Tropicimonas sp. S265A TaxID=3415134 RepID=UPI003C7B1F77